MRRILAGSTAFFALTATLLVVPVYAAPLPEAVPVTTSSDEVVMGSVEDPAPAADVQEGTTDPVAGVDASTPTLTVSRTGTDPFSLVGVTWAQDPAVTDTLVQVRVSDADGAWGPWTEVAQETADQSAADTGAQLRGGTSPLWTGPSTGVEVELVTRSGAQPTDVTLDLVDPGESAADSAPGAPEVTDTAHAATTMPAVYSRAQWGADEKIRTWAPQYAATIKAATIHHTADSNNYTAADVPAIMRSIYRYHTVSLGWGDIGYNVIADKFGRLWEGRYGGLSSTVMGAHAGGFNTATFGVSMLGNYDIAPTTQPMIDAVEAIIAWKFSLYGVDPRGTARLTSSGGGTSKYAAGVTVTEPTVFAHRDVGSTACPGRYGYARMDEIRAGVAALMAAGSEPTIAARYASDPALRASLGAAVGSGGSTAGVSWQQYERGYMYWTASTGAHVVAGQIWGVYAAAGGPAALGAPLTDELGTPDRVGRFNHFANGASIYWTPATGAQLVGGQIRNLWQQTGWETGPLGYPTSGEVPAAGGRYSTFQRGTVFWTAAGGAVEVHGPVAAEWSARGGLSWAVPTSSQATSGAGVYNTFSGERSIYWSQSTGARVVQGLIRARWLATGGPTGPLGLPVSDEHAEAPGVLASTFQDGVVYWTPAGGVRVVQGAIARRWAALGGLDWGYGLPVTDELTPPDRVGRFNHFAGGASIYWSQATSAHAVQGQIRDLWASMGWETGILGYPTSDELDTADGGGRVNTFQTGAVIWSPATGARAVYGGIYTRYAALGGVTSQLGYPTRSEYAVPGGRASDFEHGRITWTAAPNVITVSYD
ncbi:N-acetylmuramoyl-L-alanine amidase [Modestobacter excelsi]|uniref:N-acetylmuramoyl-L-alanine amidase n=1 Tax=Modestobacter excelsi TaxID=2213161 RepID=UPI00110D13B8|nr:N-acetylmuramoyl-L-alanine amidase [Modestobacter excelsi]